MSHEALRSGFSFSFESDFCRSKLQEEPLKQRIFNSSLDPMASSLLQPPGRAELDSEKLRAFFMEFLGGGVGVVRTEAIEVRGAVKTSTRFQHSWQGICSQGRACTAGTELRSSSRAGTFACTDSWGRGIWTLPRFPAPRVQGTMILRGFGVLRFLDMFCLSAVFLKCSLVECRSS